VRSGEKIGNPFRRVGEAAEGSMQTTGSSPDQTEQVTVPLTDDERYLICLPGVALAWLAVVRAASFAVVLAARTRRAQDWSRRRARRRAVLISRGVVVGE